MDLERLLENERLRMQQIRELDMEELQVEEVDESSSDSLDPDRLLENERLQMQQVRELDMEELLIEEVDEASSSSDDDVDNFLFRHSDGQTGEHYFTFDTRLASLHTYLGEVDETHVRLAFLEGGTILNLPMFYLKGVVLFPEATLPLRVILPRFKAVIERALHQVDAPYTIGVISVHRNTDDGSVRFGTAGTTAEIRQYRQLDDGSLNVVARGQQRFRMRRSWIDVEGVPYAEVQIVKEDTPLRTPKDIFAQLASVTDFRKRHNYKLGNVGEHYRLALDLEKESTPVEKSRVKCGAIDGLRRIPRASLSFWPEWVYQMHDSYSLARRAAELWKKIVGTPKLDDYLRKPDILSFHIGSKLPVSESSRQELLEIDGISYRLRREIQLLESFNHIRCNSCLTLIANRSDMVAMSSDGPLNAYVNPNGFVHEIITVYNTTGLALVGSPKEGHSWFPGYAWTITNCAQCEKNMGWLFTATKKKLLPRSFWGIRSSQVTDDT